MKYILLGALLLSSQTAFAETFEIYAGDSIQDVINTAEEHDRIVFRSSASFNEHLVFDKSLSIEAGDGFSPAIIPINDEPLITIRAPSYLDLDINIKGIFLKTGPTVNIFDLREDSKVSLEDSYLSGELFSSTTEVVIPDAIGSGYPVTGLTISRNSDLEYVITSDDSDLLDPAQMSIANAANRLQEVILTLPSTIDVSSLDTAQRYIRRASSHSVFTGDAGGRFGTFDYLAMAAYRLNRVTYDTRNSSDATEDLELVTRDISRIAMEMAENAVSGSDNESAILALDNAKAQLENGWHYEALREFGQAWREGNG